MVHQKWKRHLSFEELDKRIAMNSDAYPRQSIAFEMPARNHGPSFELRSVLLSERSASDAIQQFEMRPFDAHQISIPRFVPRYEFIRFNPRQMIGKMNGEGEGRAGSNHTPPSLPPLVTKVVIAEGDVGKPAISSRIVEPIASTIVQLPPGLIVAKQDLPRSTSNPIQSQTISRPDPIAVNPQSLAAQPDVLAPSVAAGKIHAAPLSDGLTVKSVVHSVSAPPQEFAHPSKAALNVVTIATPTSNEQTQTESVARKRVESTKPTKDGMFSFSMDLGYLRTKSEQSNSSQTRWTRQSEALPRQSQEVSVEAMIDTLATNARRLPIPNGMIEIHGNTENSLQNGLVAKATINPFEILQLFIGSTNMMQSPVSSDSRSESAPVVGLNSEASSEVATSEDILVTLGIGAVLAIAIRERKNRIRTNPLLATVPRPVA